MQGVLHGFQENYCGGGVWLLTLLLAASTILTYATITPANVKAADDTWSLYRWDGDRITPVTTTLKFTGLASFKRSNDAAIVGVARGTDGRDYTSYNGYLITATEITRINAYHLCSPSQGLTGHSGCGASTTDKTGAKLSVDTEGRAWVQNTTSYVGATPTPVQGNDSIEYSTIDGGNEAVLLLGHPRAKTPQTIINQMPTTGAPTGLASIGLLSTGIGLVGVMLMLMRRRV